jgi:hypothetical protein
MTRQKKGKPKQSLSRKLFRIKQLDTSAGISLSQRFASQPHPTLNNATEKDA